ncbi:MAG: hypothetical protein JO209_06895 [Acidisphaera sp.]|nr:hypothetical protein [Acidisphaera sp.]
MNRLTILYAAWTLAVCGSLAVSATRSPAHPIARSSGPADPCALIFDPPSCGVALGIQASVAVPPSGN